MSYPAALAFLCASVSLCDMHPRELVMHDVHTPTQYLRSMRCALLLATALCASTTLAQVTSVQDGDWMDPATWDCNCVPVLQDVEVLHTVQFTSNMKMTMPTLHVASGAVITMDGPHLVFMLEEVVNDGLMLLAGSVDVDGELFNNGVVQVEGEFLSHGLVVMGGLGTTLTAIDMEMGGTISGQGHICISGFSVNYGSIEGEVDVCDLTPTMTTPPYLDINTGTVAPTVTHCVGGTCHTGVPEEATLENVKAWPVPARELLTLEGLPTAFACTLEVRDAVGRIVPVNTVRNSDCMIVDVSTLPAGMYALVLSTPKDTRCVTVVVER